MSYSLHPPGPKARWILSLTLLLLGCGGAGGAANDTRSAINVENAARANSPLKIVAMSDMQWTGIGVSRGGRIFVNYPRWSPDVRLSVAELDANGQPTPFPTAQWNDWRQEHPSARWVAVQSVVVDKNDDLWVLDTGNPLFGGVVPGATKLVHIDLKQNKIIRTYSFEPPVISKTSYLNDVRFDLDHGVAFLTDSNDGGLVVLDLNSGKARRVLKDHPSTQPETGIKIVIDGKPWMRGGRTPKIASDGIAFDARGDKVYYQALSGRTLYRIPASVLRNPESSEEDLVAAVEAVGEVGPSDGLIAGPQGEVYLSSLEENAIRVWTPSGVTTLVQDPILAWPDSFAWGYDGTLYVTTSQIHRAPKPSEPYRILKIKP